MAAYSVLLGRLTKIHFIEALINMGGAIRRMTFVEIMFTIGLGHIEILLVRLECLVPVLLKISNWRINVATITIFIHIWHYNSVLPEPTLEVVLHWTRPPVPADFGGQLCTAALLLVLVAGSWRRRKNEWYRY